MGSQEERPPVKLFVYTTEYCYCSFLFHFFTGYWSLNEFSGSESCQTDLQGSRRFLFIEGKQTNKQTKIQVGYYPFQYPLTF